MADEIKLESPLDMHVHFRRGEMLRTVVPLTAATFAGAMAMPNTDPPIFDTSDATAYYGEIRDATGWTNDFRPYLTIYFRTDLTFARLAEARPHILAVKMYPIGLTTGSQHGCDPDDPQVAYVLEALEGLGIPLSVHPEAPGYHEDRERLFAPHVIRWAARFPRLKIILEHLSDRRSLDLLHRPNIFATITAHHLLLTGDDLIGPPLRPHNYCLPVVKRPKDRDALVVAVTAGPLADKIMFGSDSAPHPISKKECCGCAAGCFTAPIALQLLADVFDRAGRLDRLQAFVSDNARRIHGIDPPVKSVRLVREPFSVPDRYGEVVPMWAGRAIPWRIAP